jgi:hypothetical protein
VARLFKSTICTFFVHGDKGDILIFLDVVFEDTEVFESAGNAKDAAEEGDMLLL